MRKKQQAGTHLLCGFCIAWLVVFGLLTVSSGRAALAQSPRSKSLEDLWEKAREKPGTPQAHMSLARILIDSPQPEEQERAYQILFGDPEKGIPDLALHFMSIFAAPRGERWLQRIIDESPHLELRAKATYCLARNLTRQARQAGMRSRGPLSLEGESAREEARRLLALVVELYPDVPFQGNPLGASARRDLFEMESLGIGATAPEIEGRDVHGSSMKLSDYRGKVVVLNFWGYW